MATHKLDFNQFDQIDYHLVAIHTSIEDYRLAYFINQKLPINLSRNKNEILKNIKEGEAKFSWFEYFDSENEVTWELIQNKNKIINPYINKSQNLFSELDINQVTKTYLLPELNKVDFFLKIDNLEDPLILEIPTIIKTIEHISTAYIVETEAIKSKNNLIF